MYSASQPQMKKGEQCAPRWRARWRGESLAQHEHDAARTRAMDPSSGMATLEQI